MQETLWKSFLKKRVKPRRLAKQESCRQKSICWNCTKQNLRNKSLKNQSSSIDLTFRSVLPRSIAYDLRLNLAEHCMKESGARRYTMESKVKLFGHPIHPMLIVFPLGLLVTSLIFDIIYLITKNSSFGPVSFWMIAAGVVGGLVAALFGLLDWLNIPAGTRAKSVGLWHGLGAFDALIQAPGLQG